MASISTCPRTVEDIFKDYSARHSGVVRALTYDVDEFYSLCDPEKENLCLYGHPNEAWDVTLPAQEVPPELPEPALGINFARDGMKRKDWLTLVALHSDCWLLSVAFYFGGRLNHNESNAPDWRIKQLMCSVAITTSMVSLPYPVEAKIDSVAYRLSLLDIPDIPPEFLGPQLEKAIGATIASTYIPAQLSSVFELMYVKSWSMGKNCWKF